MYTIDDLIDAVKQNEELYDFLQRLSHDFDCLIDLAETYSYTESETLGVLEQLDVKDAEDRLVWFNCVELSGGQIIQLANVDFTVNECNYCEVKGYHGDPIDWDDFQGVNHGNCGVLFGEINGKSFETQLCSECFGKVESFLL